MNELKLGLNLIFNSVSNLWNFLVSDSVPLVVRMLLLAPLFILILSLVFSVFSNSSVGKIDL